MKDFNQFLEIKNLKGLLKSVKFKYPGFKNDEKVFKLLSHLVNTKRKTLLILDCDPDGWSCGYIIKHLFKKMGYTDFTIYYYENRDHRLNPKAVELAIDEYYEYVIICDTGSSSMDLLKRLDAFDIKTILLDHHVTDYKYEDYPKSVGIINTILDNRETGSDFKLSAGALTYYVMHEFARRNQIDISPLSSIALVSLYSDCMDMTNELNRAVYFKATALPQERLPNIIRHFMNQYVSFNRRFIEFRFTPKINALFRAEEFGLINKYLVDNDFTNIIGTIEDINDVHSSKRLMIDEITDILPVLELDNFVIANLHDLGDRYEIYAEKLYNYTGLIANNLCSKYGKPAVVLCSMEDRIKGSFRDSLSREYRTIFSKFCKAEGHEAAFGIHLEYKDYPDFIAYLKRVDKKFFIRLPSNSPVELNITNKDDKQISQMSLYNEFAGVGAPVALIRSTVSEDMKPKYNKYEARYYWGGFTINSAYKLPKGKVIKMRPTRMIDVRLVVV